MIRGCKRWDDRDAFYVQTNNSIEALLRAHGGKGWLESCGPSAMVNCLAAMGVKVEAARIGAWTPQPEDIVTLYLNDPRNADRFARAERGIKPGSIPGNRVAAYYPDAAMDLYSVHAALTLGLMGFDSLASFLRGGKAVQLCLVNPGHYVAAVAFDDDAQEIVYHDSWPDRFADKNGFKVRMGRKEYESNVKPLAIVYSA